MLITLLYTCVRAVGTRGKEPDLLVRCSNSPFVFGKFCGGFPFAIIGALIAILFDVTVALCSRAYNRACLSK